MITIVSKKRRLRRYENRQKERNKKRQTYSIYDNYEWVFSKTHLYLSYRKAIKSVAWKSSVQRWICHSGEYLYQLWTKLMKGKWKSKGFYEFDINERGKLRHIRSCDLEERIVQKCLCDYCLVPLLGKTLIYDNGASTKNKGYSFAIKRVRRQLKRHIKKHGNKGWVLLFDFSKFFDNISHDISKRIIRKQITDKRILQLCNAFIDAFGDIGLGLGSQISQVLALAVPNRLDHIIKETTQADKYERYMDDGCIIDIDKNKQLQRLEIIKQVCKESGIILNEKKTQIIPLSKGFKYLKSHFYIEDGKKSIQKIDRTSPVRERRKIKKMSNLRKIGKVKLSDAYTSLQSWRSHAKKYNAHKTVHEMENLYRKLFLSKQNK